MPETHRQNSGAERTALTGFAASLRQEDLLSGAGQDLAVNNTTGDVFPAASEDIPAFRVRVPDTVELGRRSWNRAPRGMGERCITPFS